MPEPKPSERLAVYEAPAPQGLTFVRRTGARPRGYVVAPAGSKLRRRPWLGGDPYLVFRFRDSEPVWMTAHTAALTAQSGRLGLAWEPAAG